MKVKLLFLIGSLFSWAVQASIKLNISIIYKKGVSRELVLSNELHVSETTEDGKPVKLTMNNGIQYVFTPFFYSQGLEFGPTSILNIHGKITSPSGKTIKNLEDLSNPTKLFLIQLGQEKKYIFNDHQEQEIEITIRPSMLK